ncbi:MAG: MerR family transcriptional regulator [Thermoanaerobaculia bacterium]
MSAARLTISDVHRKTGIPVTTLRFYEKELPDFFHVEKTAGGHRRYTEASVAQFQMVRRMVEQEGVRLGQLRDQLAPSIAQAEIRQHLDLLLAVHAGMTDEIERMRVRIEALEIELASLRRERASRNPKPDKKKRWF